VLKFNSVEIVKEVKELMTAKMMKSNPHAKQDIRTLLEDDDYMEHQCYRLVLSKYFDTL
jgi:hypothetical protein